MESNVKKINSVIIIILAIIIIGLVGFVVFDKINSNNNTNCVESTNSEIKNQQNTEEINKGEEKDKELSESNNNTIAKRTCIGVYSGNAALIQDAQTGQFVKGTLKIELKTNGTYELKKEDWLSVTGSYTIIENALLLKTSPDTCGPDSDCSATYSHFLDISEDCTTISWGYGSYFFDSDFKLTK